MSSTMGLQPVLLGEGQGGREGGRHFQIVLLARCVWLGIMGDFAKAPASLGRFGCAKFTWTMWTWLTVYITCDAGADLDTNC